MSSEIPAACSACGSPLGPKDEEIAHPDDPNPPDDPHFQVQIRSDDEERLQCTETGQLARAIPPNDPDHPANEGKGEGEGQEEKSRQPQNRDGGQEVYDLPEEKTPLDILKEVVTNEHYGLDEPQIKEVRGWAEDYDGQIPPNVLEDLLKNMKGVQKQTANLMRQRYELKLNKYFQQQSSDDGGPSIGVRANMGTHQMGSSPTPQRPSPTPNRNRTGGEPKSEDEDDPEGDIDRREVGGPVDDGIRERRRKRRVKRRQDVMDRTAEEVAKQAAPEIARELTSNFGTYFGIPAKILEAKAEKDPDWFLEKMDKLDIGVDELLEPSEQKKREMEGKERQQHAVDGEVDEALDDLMTEDDQRGREMERSRPETDNTPQREHEDTSLEDELFDDTDGINGDQNDELPEEGNHEVDEGEEQGEEESFGEVFGEGEVT